MARFALIVLFPTPPFPLVIGMDLVRAVFRDDKRLKNKDYIDIMKENIDPLNSASMEFKAETN